MSRDEEVGVDGVLDVVVNDGIGVLDMIIRVVVIDPARWQNDIKESVIGKNRIGIGRMRFGAQQVLSVRGETLEGCDLQAHVP